jgi:hypothetical protein
LRLGLCCLSAWPVNWNVLDEVAAPAGKTAPSPLSFELDDILAGFVHEAMGAGHDCDASHSALAVTSDSVAYAVRAAVTEDWRPLLPIRPSFCASP